MFKLFRDFFFRYGLSVSRVNGTKRVEQLVDDDLLNVLYRKKDDDYVVFDCPIERVRSWGGRKLSDSHPLTSTLIEYKKDPNLNFARSQIFYFSQEYYREIKNAAQSLRINSEVTSGLTDLDPRCANYPWLHGMPDEQLERYVITLKAEHKVKSTVRRCVGIGSDYQARGEKELHRLISTYNSVKKCGYLRSCDFDGDVCANILVEGLKWVALVTNGEHRVAAMYSLGFDYIPIRVRKVDVIRFTEATHWPLVAGKHLSKKSAEEVFNVVMEGDCGTYVNVYGWP